VTDLCDLDSYVILDPNASYECQTLRGVLHPNADLRPPAAAILQRELIALLLTRVYRDGKAQSLAYAT